MKIFQSIILLVCSLNATQGSIIANAEFNNNSYTRHANFSNENSTFKSVVAFNGGSGSWIGNIMEGGSHYSYFLTAGHVVSDFTSGSDLGMTFWDFSTETFESSDVTVISHPRYRAFTTSDGDQVDFDFALVKIKTTDAFSITQATPSPILTGGMEVGKVVDIIGFGIVGHVNNRGERVEEGFLSRLGFRNEVEAITKLGDSELLSMNFDSDGVDLEGLSAPGDSGGPAYVRVTSRSFEPS